MNTVNSTAETNGQTNMPWYRYPMVWVVIALPAIVVIASMVTIKIAVDHAPVIIQKADN